MIEEAMDETVTQEEPMTGMAAPDVGTLMEEETSDMKYDMETLVGNYTEMEETDRSKLLALVASPVTRLVDTLLGEPVLQRFAMQIETPIPVEEPMAESEGMMAEGEGMMAEGEGMMTPATEQEEPTPPV